MTIRAGICNVTRNSKSQEHAARSANGQLVSMSNSTAMTQAGSNTSFVQMREASMKADDKKTIRLAFGGSSVFEESASSGRLVILCIGAAAIGLLLAFIVAFSRAN